MNSMEPYIEEFHRFLRTNDLRPKWARGIKLFKDLPRIVIPPDSENDTRIHHKEYFNHIVIMKEINHNADYTATGWIIDQLHEDWGSEDIGVFYFMDGNDAMHFRLVWG